MPSKKKKDDNNKKKKMKAMEMEVLNPSSSNNNNNRAMGTTTTTTKAVGPSELSIKIEQLITLIRLYMEIYPKITMTILCIIVIFVFKLIFFRHTHETLYIPPHLQNHYSQMQSAFELKRANIDHWCLHGGNEICQNCDDPTDPIDREDVDGWHSIHKQNVKLAKATAEKYNGGGSGSGSNSNTWGISSNSKFSLDVVFLGDETTQAWTGYNLNHRIKPTTTSSTNGKDIAKIFNKTFHKDDYPNTAILDGIPLGIAGDSISNLHWRITHGEIPIELNPKVWWILIGTNDLIHGMCSEELIILGILRLAEEIHHRKPDTVIVIQGLLPRATSKDGSLKVIDWDLVKQQEENDKKKKKKKKKKKEHKQKHNITSAAGLDPILLSGGLRHKKNRNLQQHEEQTNNKYEYEYEEYQYQEPEEEERELKSSHHSHGTSQHSFSHSSSSSHHNKEYFTNEEYPLWPSIQVINKELEDYCKQHDHLVYFDVASIFLGSLGNEHYKTKDMFILKDLMPDYTNLNTKGYQLLADVTSKELQRIIYDDNEDNYSE